MRSFAVCIAVLLSFATLAYGQYGSEAAAGSSVGQNNIAFQAAAATGSGYWQYVTKYYTRCGRQYSYVQPVWVAEKAAAVTVENPIGAVNTDNSITHQYTYNITYAQQPAAQGSTLLGYPGLTSTADVYGNVDLAANLDTFTRAAAQNSSDANALLSRLNDTFGQIASHQKDLAAAAIQAQAVVGLAVADGHRVQAQASLASALRPSDSSGGIQVTQAFKVEQGSGKRTVDPAPGNPDPTIPPLPPAAGDNLSQIQDIFAAKCVMCHGNTTPKGGINLSQVSNLTAAQVQSVLSRVTHADPQKRMPLSADGSPGEPLSVDELKLLFRSSR